MKASIYFNYTTRSLVRGGQRTVLAVFCVAVGVMAIVALQLVGLMINNALTSNVRDANGGDIAVSASTKPFTQSDLSYFDTLKNNGTITAYTALFANITGSTSNSATVTNSFTIEAVDPTNFPLVTPPTFVSPADGKISSLLTNNQVIVDKTFADQYNKKVGDSFDVHASTRVNGSQVLPVTIAGIVTDSGALAQSSSIMLISANAYHAATPATPVFYDTVDVTANGQAHIDQANKDIKAHFLTASTQTAADALKSQQTQVDFIKKFLEIAGLLALLIGGVGIVNTMQVLLSRRKIEIAMLKTTGYRRFDLYLLFGLEAGLLGLIGGLVGAAISIGLSYLVRNLIQQAFAISIPFVLDPTTIGGGILIGLVTALIFGLMPIVQAANIRPLNVIRELPGTNRIGNVFLTIGLLILLSILFCALAVVILNDVLWGISAVYGAFIFLALLSVIFGLVVLAVSVLPVPERFSFRYIALILAGVILSILLLKFLPVFGILLLIVSLMGVVIVLLPRNWKSNTKIALRNIGRQRARTTTTLLALFVGVFTIGLILVLGQDLRDTINNALAKSLSYNVVTITTSKDEAALQSKVDAGAIPGLSKHKKSPIASTVPLAIDDTPLQNLMAKSGNASATSLGRDGTFYFLSGMEGYDVANNQFPDTSSFTISDGRNLNASDAGKNDVLVSWQLVHLDPLKGHLKVGSTIIMASIDGKLTRSLTVVGVYQSKGFSLSFEPVLATNSAVTALSPAGLGQTIFYMKIDTTKVGKALAAIGSAAPNAFVYSLANIGDYIDQFLSYLLLALSTIAGLSLLAGVIIIANAVALAMLERRRELGILKSVGYTSQTVLSEVLIENGVVGGIGALLAMLLVTLALYLLGTLFFHITLGVNGVIAITIIAGSSLLAMITAAIVAWGAVRVRPLEVLRYE